jgi:hypothetical protein
MPRQTAGTSDPGEAAIKRFIPSLACDRQELLDARLPRYSAVGLRLVRLSQRVVAPRSGPSVLSSSPSPTAGYGTRPKRRSVRCAQESSNVILR